MKLKQKLITVLITTVLLGGNLLPIGSQVIALTNQIILENEEKILNQNSSTNNANVEFNSYLEGNIHEETLDVREKGKMYIELKIKQNGYLKNGIVQISGANYQIDIDEINKQENKDENIQSINENTIQLNQIQNSEETKIIELPIKIIKDNYVAQDHLDKVSQVKFIGTYINGNGKQITIEKTIYNKVKWQVQAETEISGEITKYLPYQSGEEYGVLVQSKIKNNIKDNILPVANTRLEISSPIIKDQKPQRIAVIANSTKATNGKENGKEFTADNYSYNAETGIVSIQVSNTADAQGNVSWLEGQDEYLVNYTYVGKDIYDSVKRKLDKAKQTKQQILEMQKKAKERGEEEQENIENEDAIKGEISIVSSIQLYNGENIIIPAILPYTVEEQKGSLVDFSVEGIESISKGYIYANYAKENNQRQGKEIEDKKETNYELTYSAQINDKTIIDNVEFEFENEKITSEKEEQEIGSNIITKQIKIEESIFKKILGEDGRIEVYNKDKNLIGFIYSNTMKDEQGDFVLDLANQSLNEFTIKTSAPVMEGKIEIKIEKAFVADLTFSEEEMKNFSKITLGVISKTNTNTKTLTKEIKLQEPISNAQITLEEGDEKLSTVVANKGVEINVVLDTSSVDKALFKNPIIEIQMPSQVTKVDLKETNLILDDELKIKEAKVIKNGKNQVIQIITEGTQTKYLELDQNMQNNVIAQGANINIKADLSLDPLTPGKTEKIEMFYINENTNQYSQTVNKDETEEKAGMATTNVELVAPTGVATATAISDYDTKGSNVTNMSNEKYEITTPIYEAKREVNVQGIINNNYANPIENVVILGRVPSENNAKVDSSSNLGSNFNMNLLSQITASGIDSNRMKVYYSTNAGASKELSVASNDWKEDIKDLKNVKSYLIVVDGEIEPATQLKFDYKVELPENLPYNKSSYSNYKVYYDNKTPQAILGETKESGIMGFTTGQGPELSMQLSSNIPKYSEESDIRYIAKGGAGRFWLEIKNTGKMKATNAKATIEIPDGSRVVKYVEDRGEYQISSETIELGDIEPGESKKISYYIQATNQYTFSEPVATRVLLSADNIEGSIKSNEILIRLVDAHFKIINKTNTIESSIYSSKDVFTYDVKLQEGTQQSNMTITVPLPENAKILDAYWGEGGGTEGIEKLEDKVVANCVFMGSEKNLMIKFQVEANEATSFSTQVFVQINEEEGEGHEGHENHDLQYYSNEQYIYMDKPDLSGKQEEPEKVYVRELEEFEYNFTIKTADKGSNSNIVLEDILPEEITVKSIETKVEDKEGYIDENNYTEETDGNKLKITIPYAGSNSTINITVKVTGKLKLSTDDGKAIINEASVYSDQVERKELNSITQYLEYNESAHKNSLTGEINDNSGEPTPSQTGYKISGTAWIDNNSDGKKDSKEPTISGMKVMLIYKSNSEIVKDKNTGEEKTVTTNSNGKYEFLGLPADEYLVVFLYDHVKYDLTTYHAKGVGESYNSDAINMQIQIEGADNYAGVTDTIKITDGHIRDIDIGLCDAEKFDLKLEKTISKITLTTPKLGTKTYNYDGTQLTKIEVPAKDANKSNFVVEYKIKVTNEGKVPGYARKIIDYLPAEAKFNAEINNDWYIAVNSSGAINTKLANELINPGESKEVTLVVSYATTEKMLGNVISNSAEIYESYNEQGTPDSDSNEANKLESEDDISNADIVVSVKTGEAILYTGIIITAIAILGIGIYVIKKRVIEKY